MNDLPDGVVSTCKNFADDISLFSKVKDEQPNVMSKSDFQWKILSNHDPTKHAIKGYFANKCSKTIYTPLCLAMTEAATQRCS